MSTISKKLVCIGDGSSGKTCLLTVYAYNEFPEKYVPTVFENYVATVDLGDTKVELALWDTAGQEDYSHIRPLSYQDAHVFLICFSVENRDSFDNISTKWVPEMKQYCPRVPYIIVGCKTDLRSDPETVESVKAKGMTMVLKDEGERLAAAQVARCYMECSAMKKQGVDEIFRMAARIALTTKGGGGSGGGGCCVLS